MTAAGQRIIAALEDAQRGEFSRATVNGQTWVRKDHFDEAMGSMILADLALRHDDAKDAAIHLGDAIKLLNTNK